MRFKTFVIIFLIILSAQLRAQEEILPPYGQGTIRTGMVMQSWSVEEYRRAITQFSFPIILSMPLTSHLNFTITHSPALTYWRDNYNLHGFSDTWVQGTYVFWNEKAMINVGIGVPTGKTHLSEPEFLMTKQWLTRNVFRFSSPLLGQGFCTQSSLILAIPITDVIVLGIGGQYLYKASYQPIRFTYTVGTDERIADRQYNPGDELSGHVGLDFRLGDDLKIMLDGMYTIYGRDTQEGQEVYGSGSKLNVRLAAYYRFNLNFIWMNILYRQRGKNEVLQGLIFAKEEMRTNGDQIEANVIAEAYRFDRGSIRALLDGRYHMKSDMSVADELIIGGGLGAFFELTEKLILDFHLKYLGGWYRSIEDPDRTRTTDGLDIFVGLRARL